MGILPMTPANMDLIKVKPKISAQINQLTKLF
jgi:hypothetical protein